MYIKQNKMIQLEPRRNIELYNIYILSNCVSIWLSILYVLNFVEVPYLAADFSDGSVYIESDVSD